MPVVGVKEPETGFPRVHLSTADWAVCARERLCLRVEVESSRERHLCLPVWHTHAKKNHLIRSETLKFYSIPACSLSLSTPAAESALKSQGQTETSPFWSHPSPLRKLNILQNHAFPHKASLQEEQSVTFLAVFLRGKVWRPYEDVAFLKLKSINTHGCPRGRWRVSISRHPYGKPHRQDLLTDAEISRSKLQEMWDLDQPQGKWVSRKWTPARSWNQHEHQRWNVGCASPMIGWAEKGMAVPTHVLFFSDKMLPRSD